MYPSAVEVEVVLSCVFVWLGCDNRLYSAEPLIKLKPSLKPWVQQLLSVLYPFYLTPFSSEFIFSIMCVSAINLSQILGGTICYYISHPCTPTNTV